MTRKQAILRAIEVLSKNKENNDIVLKLKEIASELPLSHWTKESIIDSILTYAEEHNNMLPYAEDLTAANNLPSTTVIEKRFNESSIYEFYKRYFPEYIKAYNHKRAYSPYANKHDSYFMDSYISNRTNIQRITGNKYVTAKTYDRYRKTNSPTLSTIIKNCNCKNYKELLILCGYKKKDKPITSKIKVTFSDSEHRNEELKLMFEKLKSETGV